MVCGHEITWKGKNGAGSHDINHVRPLSIYVCMHLHIRSLKNIQSYIFYLTVL